MPGQVKGHKADTKNQEPPDLSLAHGDPTDEHYAVDATSFDPHTGIVVGSSKKSSTADTKLKPKKETNQEHRSQ